MTELNERYIIVLCRPEGAYNLGAVCRAMKTMGFGTLALVDPAPSALVPEKVREMAIHAWDVFENAQYYPDLASALENCRMSAAFARRQGNSRKQGFCNLDTLGEKIQNLEGPIALVFGNEKHGLTTDEVRACTLSVSIPTSPDFPSLNLAQAVQLACWELRNKTQVRSAKNPGGTTGLGLGQWSELAADIVDTFEKIGFYTLGGREQALEVWRDLFARAQISAQEARWLRGTFGKLGRIGGRNESPDGGPEDPGRV